MPCYSYYTTSLKWHAILKEKPNADVKWLKDKSTAAFKNTGNYNKASNAAVSRVSAKQYDKSSKTADLHKAQKVSGWDVLSRR